MMTIRFSYRNATIVVCSLNVTVAVYLLLHAFSTSSSLPTSPSDHTGKTLTLSLSLLPFWGLIADFEPKFVFSNWIVWA